MAVAPAAQATEPRAGLLMGHSTHRTELWAGAASCVDELAPAILLHSYHAYKSTAERRLCAPGASRAPLVMAVDLVGAAASPGTRRPAPGGPPGPGGGSRGRIPAQRESQPAGLMLFNYCSDPNLAQNGAYFAFWGTKFRWRRHWRAPGQSNRDATPTPAAAVGVIATRAHGQLQIRKERRAAGADVVEVD